MIAPYYEAPPSSQVRRRILLVSYVFPPDRTVGAQRWQKMLPLLARRGWVADVIALAPPDLDAAGRAALQELPAGTRVYGVARRPVPTRVLESLALSAVRALRRPKRDGGGGADGAGAGAISARVPSIPVGDIRWDLTRPGGWRRAYYGWVEHAEVERWAHAAADVAESLGRTVRYDAIVTSSPPHMTHEAGRLAAERLGVPLVIDLRDPWFLSDRLYEIFASPMWLRLAARHEREVVEAASLVVANTEPFAAAMATRYPTARRVIAITNGADDDALPAQPAPTPRFTIRYAGTIYSERHPETLFKAAARVIRELQLTPEQFGIDLIGEFGDAAGGGRVRALADANGVGAYTTVGPRRARRDALDFLSAATMLVSFPNFSESVAISAKLFEYMRYDAWLLVLASPGSAARQLVTGTSADVASPDDPDEAAAHIARRVRDHAQGERPVGLSHEERFTRRFQAERLADALDALEVGA